jgi:DNA-binding NarL/FixJ family response regulator
MIRVAIFEDNDHLRETYEMLLNSTHGFTCVAAHPDCSDMIAVLNHQPCDIVLMDIEMPGMNGIDATRVIKQNFPKIQVLIQTVFFEDEHIYNAILAGASGYILKNTTPKGYIQAIREVHAGGSPITPGIAKRVLDLFKTNLREDISPVEEFNLTHQEKRILQLMADGKSYKMIAAELFISPETVKTHVGNIYPKLHVRSATEAVSIAFRKRIVQ